MLCHICSMYCVFRQESSTCTLPTTLPFRQSQSDPARMSLVMLVADLAWTTCVAVESRYCANAVMQGWVLLKEGRECGAGAAPVCGYRAEGAGRGGC